MQTSLILYLQLTLFSAMIKSAVAFQLYNGKYKFLECESDIALICLFVMVYKGSIIKNCWSNSFYTHLACVLRPEKDTGPIKANMPYKFSCVKLSNLSPEVGGGVGEEPVCWLGIQGNAALAVQETCSSIWSYFGRMAGKKVIQAELFQWWSMPNIVLGKAGRVEFSSQTVICCFSYRSLIDLGAEGTFL